MFDLERVFSSQKQRPSAALRANQSLAQLQRDIFESHRHRTFALAFYMTGNEMEAERILTQTFVRAFQRNDRPGAFDVDSALLEELGGALSFQHAAPAENPPGAPSLAGRNVLRGDLEAAIRDLPARERLLFLLRDVEGYSLDVIGRLLDIDERVAQRTLMSARIRLRGILADSRQPASEAA